MSLTKISMEHIQLERLVIYPKPTSNNSSILKFVHLDISQIKMCHISTTNFIMLTRAITIFSPDVHSRDAASGEYSSDERAVIYHLKIY